MEHTNGYVLSIASFFMTGLSIITPTGIIQVLTIAVLILTLIKLRRDLKNKKDNAD